MAQHYTAPATVECRIRVTNKWQLCREGYIEGTLQLDAVNGETVPSVWLHGAPGPISVVDYDTIAQRSKKSKDTIMVRSDSGYLKFGVAVSGQLAISSTVRHHLRPKQCALLADIQAKFPSMDHSSADLELCWLAVKFPASDAYMFGQVVECKDTSAVVVLLDSLKRVTVDLSNTKNWVRLSHEKATVRLGPKHLPEEEPSSSSASLHSLAPRKRSLADILDPGAPGPQQAPSKTSTSVQSALMAPTLVALTEDQITRIAAQQLLATMPPGGPGMASALPLAAAPWSLQGDELAGARLAPVGLVIPAAPAPGVFMQQHHSGQAAAVAGTPTAGAPLHSSAAASPGEFGAAETLSQMHQLSQKTSHKQQGSQLTSAPAVLQQVQGSQSPLLLGSLLLPSQASQGTPLLVGRSLSMATTTPGSGLTTAPVPASQLLTVSQQLLMQTPCTGLIAAGSTQAGAATQTATPLPNSQEDESSPDAPDCNPPEAHQTRLCNQCRSIGEVLASVQQGGAQASQATQGSRLGPALSAPASASEQQVEQLVGALQQQGLQLDGDGTASSVTCGLSSLLQAVAQQLQAGKQQLSARAQLGLSLLSRSQDPKAHTQGMESSLRSMVAPACRHWSARSISQEQAPHSQAAQQDVDAALLECCNTGSFSDSGPIAQLWQGLAGVLGVPLRVTKYSPLQTAGSSREVPPDPALAGDVLPGVDQAQLESGAQPVHIRLAHMPRGWQGAGGKRHGGPLKAWAPVVLASAGSAAQPPQAAAAAMASDWWVLSSQRQGLPAAAARLLAARPAVDGGAAAAVGSAQPGRPSQPPSASQATITTSMGGSQVSSQSRISSISAALERREQELAAAVRDLGARELELRAAEQQAARARELQAQVQREVRQLPDVQGASLEDEGLLEGFLVNWSDIGDNASVERGCRVLGMVRELAQLRQGQQDVSGLKQAVESARQAVASCQNAVKAARIMLANQTGAK